jgi:hypothetical protein
MRKDPAVYRPGDEALNMIKNPVIQTPVACPVDALAGGVAVVVDLTRPLRRHEPSGLLGTAGISPPTKP